MATKRGPRAKAKEADNVVAIRGPHAERTAAMRKRLIEAAIECLEQDRLRRHHAAGGDR